MGQNLEEKKQKLTYFNNVYKRKVLYVLVLYMQQWEQRTSEFL